MKPLISVIIPTHNPHPVRLSRTLAGLQTQSLPTATWELIVVDNGSSPGINFSSINIGWHPNPKIVREDRLGLTRARLAGIEASQGEFLVFVDDDNVLDPHYLKQVEETFRRSPTLGALGGKSIPEFEVPPEAWVDQFWVCLALRDFGDQSQVYCYADSLPERHHPQFAPIGAGMAIRREAAEHYVSCIANNPQRLALDRTGKSLQSGGDCDINLTLLAAGWAVGYFPQLQLTHLISANRLTKDYLARLNYASSRSWIQVLNAHNLRPWPQIPTWSVLPRQIKAFLSYQAWCDPANYIRWRGACGMFEGLGALSN
jgi:glycosyltransferase involved in cell wall biosynthesis